MSRVLHNSNDLLSHDNTESIILYGSAISPCVRRCRITLLEKGINFDEVEIDLASMEQRDPEYLKLNPNGFVPTLAHGKFVVYESSVINEYLEHQFPERPLVASNPALIAETHMWIAAEGVMAKLFRSVMYQRTQGPLQHVSRTHQEAQQISRLYTDDPFDLAWERKVWHLNVLTPEQEKTQVGKLLSWLDIVEKSLIGKKYLVGEQFSQADISMYPRITMYDFLGLNISPERYPNVLMWMENLVKRPSFDASLNDKAKKLAKLATGPLLPYLRKALGQPSEERSMITKFKLRLLGKIIRKKQGVKQLLNHQQTLRRLPLPRASKETIVIQNLKKPVPIMGNDDVILLGHPSSPHSKRITYLLKLLKVNYQFKQIDLVKNEHQTIEYLNINPLCELPTLSHGGKDYFDSSVIAQYLLTVFDRDYRYVATDSQSQAQQHMWLALESGSHKEFKPLWEKYSLKRVASQPHIVNEEKSLQRIQVQLEKLELALNKTPYLCGEQLVFADIAWFSRFHVLNQVPQFDLNTFPAVAKWFDLMEQRLA